MRAAAAVGVALVMSFPVASFAQGSAGADEGAIRKIVQQHDQTRSSGDWKGAAALYVEDGTTLTSAGEWRRGRASIEKGGAALGGAVYKGAKYSTTVNTVRLLAPTVALADASFEISGIGGSGTRKGNSTYVLVKSGETWRIAAVRSMVPTPAGPSPGR